MEEHRILTYLVTRVFLIVLAVCLTWQTVLISQLYFGYKVESGMRMRIPENVTTECVSFCTRYTDVLQFDRLRQETGRDWSYTINDQLVRMYQENLTIAEILAFTPDVKDIIDSAVYRSNDSYFRNELSSQLVYQKFHVSKFLNLEHVCYKICLLEEFTMPYSYFAVTPVSPGFVYEVFLREEGNSAIRRSDYLKFVATQNSISAYPFRSIGVTGTIRRFWNEANGTAEYNQFRSFRVRLRVKLLPSPYVTHCMDYAPFGFNSDAECRQSCLRTQTAAGLDRVPFSVIVNDSSDQKIISYRDITNETLMRQLLSMEQRCDQLMCKWPACDYGISLTQTQSVVRDSGFSIRLDIPSSPWIYTEATASLDIVEYVTYVMGILSMYSGLGIIAFSPIRVTQVAKSVLALITRRNALSHSSNSHYVKTPAAATAGTVPFPPFDVRQQSSQPQFPHLTPMSHTESMIQ